MKTPEPAPRKVSFQARLNELGSLLQGTLQAVVQGLPEEARQTGGMSLHTGMNKVFTSRLLTALRQENPLAVVYRLPGPDPIMRFLSCEALAPIPRRDCLAAKEAVGQFQRFIDQEAGGRSSLQSLMSSWLDENRSEFFAKRKQAAFRAVSELKGAAVQLNMSTAILAPSANPDKLDLVWLMGLIGLQRLRPNARVHMLTQRLDDDEAARKPEPIVGPGFNDILPGGIQAFCPNGPAPFHSELVGKTMNYFLEDGLLGPKERTDMVTMEINREELRRFRTDAPERRSFLYANPVPPCEELVFDVYLHRSLTKNEAPEFLMYDTAGTGAKDPNDPSSSLDQLDSAEEIEYHDTTLGIPSSKSYEPYELLMESVFSHLDWPVKDFHLWRVRIPYPLHSCQATFAFSPKPA